jgi:hypothetical protein
MLIKYLCCSFRIGAEQLLQALNKLLSLATTGSVSKQPQTWCNMVIELLH